MHPGQGSFTLTVFIVFFSSSSSSTRHQMRDQWPRTVLFHARGRHLPCVPSFLPRDGGNVTQTIHCISTQPP
ncbi:hypothetical protein BC940DRAFT_152453 [Gongronella butleri]|nr:hypothetical protein BC940DRAFT_152453 [Gongronella butleri]